MDAFDALDGGLDAAADFAVRENRTRGRVAETRLWRLLWERGYDVARQVPVVSLNDAGLPRAGRVDVVPTARPGGRRPRAAYEVKSIDLGSRQFRGRNGALAEAPLEARVLSDAEQAAGYRQGLQALNHMRQLRGLPPLYPPAVRLVYQVPQRTSRADAAAFQTLAKKVAATVGVPVTVFMPGSRAMGGRPLPLP